MPKVPRQSPKGRLVSQKKLLERQLQKERSEGSCRGGTSEGEGWIERQEERPSGIALGQQQKNAEKKNREQEKEMCVRERERKKERAKERLFILRICPWISEHLVGPWLRHRQGQLDGVCTNEFSKAIICIPPYKGKAN